MTNHPNRKKQEKIKSFLIGDVKIGVQTTGLPSENYNAKIYIDGALQCEMGSPMVFEETLRTIVGNIACHIVDYN